MRLLSSRQVRLASVLVLSVVLINSVQVEATQISTSTDHYHGHDHHHHHDDDKNNSFCHGMYMTMFTDGFRFSLHSSKDSSHHHGNSTSSTPPCLAYYFRSWKLSMSGKFRGAMVFSFLLALLTEGLAATRFTLIEYIHKHHAGQRHRKIVLTIVYALQSWMGTMIMLVSMMYSIELLLSIIAGLMVGNFIFVRNHPQKIRMNSNMGGSGALTSSNPSVARPEERQGLLSTNPVDESDSIGGLESVSGLQMQTRKEE